MPEILGLSDGCNQARSLGVQTWILSERQEESEHDSSFYPLLCHLTLRNYGNHLRPWPNRVSPRSLSSSQDHTGRCWVSPGVAPSCFHSPSFSISTQWLTKSPISWVSIPVNSRRASPGPGSKWAMSLCKKARTWNSATTPSGPWARPSMTRCSSGWWSGLTRPWTPRCRGSSSLGCWTSPASRSLRCAWPPVWFLPWGAYPFVSSSLPWLSCFSPETPMGGTISVCHWISDCFGL